MSICYPEKSRYNTDDLVEITRILRGPGGCPWDIKQTHDSIRGNFIEETYEAIEAIDNQDMVGLQEELGDILLQIALHCQMEDEKGCFNYDDVVDGICKKLIVRHPHVFGEAAASNESEALKNWDAIKRATNNTDKQADLLRHVPKSLPALMRAEKVQERAKRVGFDWDDVSGAWNALESEVQELNQAMTEKDADAMEDELGDVLFSVVNVSRFIHVDSEKALSRSVDKFVTRFSAVEALAKERNLDMNKMSIDELDALWNEVKKR